MKKLISLTLGCLLGGCATQPQVIQKPIAIGQGEFRQDLAPLPWVHVLPSERAIAYTDVDFHFIAQHIRQDMVLDIDKFKGVNLVLVDYTVLPATQPKKELMRHAYEGQVYCKEYIVKPERYFMRISFYQSGVRPPCPPLFVGTAVVRVSKAAPEEAMRFMATDIVKEHIKSPLSKIEVNLD